MLRTWVNRCIHQAAATAPDVDYICWLQLLRTISAGDRPQQLPVGWIEGLPGGACTLKACSGHCLAPAACLFSNRGVPHYFKACISGIRLVKQQ